MGSFAFGHIVCCLHFPIQNLRLTLWIKYPTMSPLVYIFWEKIHKSYLHDILPFHSLSQNRSSFLRSPFHEHARLLHVGRKFAREVRAVTAASSLEGLRENLCGLMPWFTMYQLPSSFGINSSHCLLVVTSFSPYTLLNWLFRVTVAEFCLFPSKNDTLEA